MVEHASSNGTFFNEEPIKSGNKNTKRLCDGSEASFELADRARPDEHNFVFRQVDTDHVFGLDGRSDLCTIFCRGSYGTVARAIDKGSRKWYGVKTTQTEVVCISPNDGQQSLCGEGVGHKNLQPRIAIIGGGPGGPTLLLTLHKRRIPTTLHEREPSFASRSHTGGLLDLGYDTGLRALRENGLKKQFKQNVRPEGDCNTYFNHNTSTGPSRY